MIKIEVENLDTIAKEYYNRVKNIKRNGIVDITTKEKKDAKDLFDYFIKNLESIILCKPSELSNIIPSEFFDKKRLGFNLFKTYMKGQYKKYIDSNGNWLAKQLRVNVCPYCNRQYTFTVSKEEGKGIRPQFDHFYPKSENPFLALSFYNLIPSCSICNLAKGIDPIKINPYEKGFDEDCRFSIDKIENCVLNGKDKDWTVALPKDGNHVLHVTAFALNDLYNQHKDYVEEIVFKAQSYNEGYYESLKDSFSNLGLTENEMRLMIFGNYIEPSEYCKRPLSKLTADILDQLETLK